MAFQKWDPDEGYGTRSDEPEMAIDPETAARLNAVAVRRWFDDVERVTRRVDPETGRLGLEPGGDEDDPASAKLTGNNGGAEVYLGKSLLGSLGAAPPDEREHIPLEYDDEAGMAVADLSGMPGPEDGVQVDVEIENEDTEDGDSGFEKQKCSNCGATLGKDWRVADAEARDEGTHPAPCPECGESPLPPVARPDDDPSLDEPADETPDPELDVDHQSSDGVEVGAERGERAVDDAGATDPAEAREDPREVPVEALEPVGGNLAERLRGAGICTVGDVLEAGVGGLTDVRYVANRAEYLYEDAEAIAGDAPVPTAEQSTDEDDDAPMIDQLGLDPDAVVDALTDATALHDVRHQLGINRRADARQLVGECGLIEELTPPNAGVDRDTAEAAVREVDDAD